MRAGAHSERVPAPDWTDFNHSDSGVTLLQLFAFLAFAFLVGLALKRWRRSRSARSPDPDEHGCGLAAR